MLPKFVRIFEVCFVLNCISWSHMDRREDCVVSKYGPFTMSKSSYKFVVFISDQIPYADLRSIKTLCNGWSEDCVVSKFLLSSMFIYCLKLIFVFLFWGLNCICWFPIDKNALEHTKRRPCCIQVVLLYCPKVVDILPVCNVLGSVFCLAVDMRTPERTPETDEERILLPLN